MKWTDVTRAAGATVLSLCLSAQACAEPTRAHKIAGRSVTQVFDDPRLVKLASAACVGDKNGIAVALRSGADPNGRGLDGVTPLVWAIDCGNLKGVEALLDAGGNPNLPMDGRASPTFVALHNDDPKVLRLLLETGGDANVVDEGRSMLIEALLIGVEEDDWRRYDMLLAAGADINWADEGGGTVATSAASFARFERVADLLERGYAQDLQWLANTVEMVEVPDDLEVDRGRVLKMLAARGVKPSTRRPSRTSD